MKQNIDLFWSFRSPYSYLSTPAALERSGHWGVPTFVFNGEPFFGEDRFGTLCWRLAKEGLAI